jgi:hypothetical protein
MLRLHYVSTARKRAVVATAIIGLIVSVAVTVMIAGRGRSRAAAHTRSAMPQMGFFGYWSEDEGFKSNVVINNASNIQLTVNPILYSLNGHPLAVDPITLAPRRQLTANVADWLAQSGAGEDFKQGNLVLNYEAPDAADLGAQVTVTNPESSLSFDFRNEMPMSFESSHLEGMWWLPDGASRYDLVLSNMKDSEVNIAVHTSGGQGQSHGSSFDVALAPHQTQIINLDDKKPAFTTNAGAGKMGGISITHTGAPGGVLAFGLLSKRQTGFSSHFPFEDPATSRSQTLAAAHVFIGKPDTSGFSKNTRFTSIALVRNASDAVLDVKPSISFVHNNAPRTLDLDTRHLQPQQVDAIDLAEELKRAGILGAVSGAGFTFASTGAPGALMAHLTSYDQTRNHVFDVPMKDASIKMNRFSGSYPFSLEGGRQSVVHVRNTTGEKARFTIQLDFEAGSYTLPIQILDPQQEAAINIRQLRDSQTSDSIDRVIPKELTSGQANWHEHGPQALIGRLEQFDAAEAMASSFSCPGPGCCVSTELVVTAPGSMSKVLGQTGHFKLLETRIEDCDGTIYGPFDVSADAGWSSTNGSVVTVGAVSSSGVLCSFVGVGQANVHADFQGIISQIDPLSETCEGTFSPFPDDGVVEVNIPKYFEALSVTDANLGCGTNTAGYGVKVKYQVLDENMNPIQMAGMKPQELVTVTDDAGNVISHDTQFRPFATPQTTDAAGQFTDIPVGTCFGPPPPSQNVCVTSTQLFNIIVTTGGASATYDIATITFARDCLQGVKVSTTDPNKEFSRGTVN